MTASVPPLAGRVAVVTGGASGAGHAVCARLAALVVAVAVVDGDPKAVAAVVERIGVGGGRAVGAVADCLGSGAIERMRHEVERGLGPVDLVVALGAEAPALAPARSGCSGCSGRGEMPGGDWPDVARGLVAAFLAARVFLPGMIDRRRGTIVTAPGPDTFARQLALGLAGSGVRVVAARPPAAPPGRHGGHAGVADAVLSAALGEPALPVSVKPARSATLA